MRTIITIAALAMLSACAATPGTQADAPDLPGKPSNAAPSTTADDGPETNDRGYLVKKLGEKAGWTGVNGDESAGATFVIDKVTVDPPCEEYGEKPEAGHTLLLHIRVATGSNRDVAMVAAGVLNPYSFAEIGADGITRDAQDGYCTDVDASLPIDYGINQKYAGTIEIVVPEANGNLILKDQAMSNAGGWEWSY